MGRRDNSRNLRLLHAVSLAKTYSKLNLNENELKLAQALRYGNRFVVEKALDAIKEQRLQKLIPLLQPLASDRHLYAYLRLQTIVTVGAVLEETGQLPDYLLPLLHDPEWLIRVETLETIEEIGAVQTLRNLTNLLRDQHPTVRSYCAVILSNTGDERFVPVLQAALKRESDDHPRASILKGLIEFGTRDLLPQLIQLLSTDWYSARCWVVNRLDDLELTTDESKLVFQALSTLRKTEPTRAVQSTIDRVMKSMLERFPHDDGSNLQ